MMDSRCSSSVAADEVLGVATVAADVAADVVAADVADDQFSICQKMGGSNSRMVRPYHVWLHPIVIRYIHIIYRNSCYGYIQ